MDIPNNQQFYRGKRIQIFPNDTQIQFIEKCIETSNFVYDWALQKQNENKKLFYLGNSDKKYIHKFELCRSLTDLRKENKDLQIIPYTVEKNAIFRLTRSIKNII